MEVSVVVFISFLQFTDETEYEYSGSEEEEEEASEQEGEPRYLQCQSSFLQSYRFTCVLSSQIIAEV